jgi:hypothetical protein
LQLSCKLFDSPRARVDTAARLKNSSVLEKNSNISYTYILIGVLALKVGNMNGMKVITAADG